MVASDVLNPVYGEDNISDLANAVARLCAARPAARFLLAYEERSGEGGEAANATGVSKKERSLFDLFCAELESRLSGFRPQRIWSSPCGKREVYCFGRQ